MEAGVGINQGLVSGCRSKPMLWALFDADILARSSRSCSLKSPVICGSRSTWFTTMMTVELSSFGCSRRFCAAKTMLLFDVTKHPVLGIDNLMDAESALAHFIPGVVFSFWFKP